MPLTLRRPVADNWEITGEYLQDWGHWSPDHVHMGIDYGCPTGTPVFSCTVRGVVHAVHNAPIGQWMGDFGLCVVVKAVHPETEQDWYFLYAHLSRADVSAGKTVKTGDRIGLSGASGNVTGDHLHIQACLTPQFSRDIEQSGDPQRWMRDGVKPPVVVPPVVPPPSTAERALAEVISLNEAIMLRGAIIRVAYDPDYAKVQQAAAALRKAGFVL